MRKFSIIKQVTLSISLFTFVLIALSSALAQDEDTLESPWVETGPLKMVDLRVEPSVNRVYTPPPNNLNFQRVPKSSTINVNFNPASCTSSTLAPVVTWPSQARSSFLQAVNIWEGLVTSPVPIEVDACWRPLGPGVLGSAGALNSFTDGKLVYPVALANGLAGSDLDVGTSDILTNFSSEFDWYFGLDGNTPGTQLDFVSVILHELAHGLGFSGSMEVGRINGTGPIIARWGSGGTIPSAYDQFVENGSNQSIINTAIFPNPSTALLAQVTSNNLFFDGPQTRVANGNQPAPIYAPSNWNQGSSFSHLAESFNDTPNALMTFSLENGEARHHPGPVGLGLLHDVGWGRIAPVAGCEITLPCPIKTYLPLVTR